MKTRLARWCPLALWGRGLLLAVLALFCIAQGAAVRADEAPASFNIKSFLKNSGYDAQATAVKSTMNFDDCLDFEWEVDSHWCTENGLPVPSPCTQFSYREPNAVVEVMCDYGKQYLKTGLDIGSLLSSAAAPAQQKCNKSITTKEGIYRHEFYETKVYNPSPLSRFYSSGSTTDVVKSLTCGVFGLVGTLTKLGGLLDFDLTRLLDPATWAKAIQDSLKDITTSLTDLVKNIANIPAMLTESLQSLATGLRDSLQGMVDSITDSIKALQDIGPGITRGLQGLIDGTTTLASLSFGDMAKMGTALLDIGSSVAEIGAVGGLSDLVSAGVAFTSAGEALTTMAAGGEQGTLTQAEAAATAASIQTSLQTGLDGLVDASTVASFGNKAETAWVLPKLESARFAAASSAENSDPRERFAPNQGNPYLRWANTPIGYVQKDSSGKPLEKGGLAVGRLMEDGPAQQAYKQVKTTVEKMEAWLNEALGRAEKQFARPAERSAAELCSVQFSLNTTGGKLETLKKRLQDDKKPPQLVTNATYLDGRQRQLGIEGVPNAACPLTHAGYIVNDGGEQNPLAPAYGVNMVNCHLYCWPKKSGPSPSPGPFSDKRTSLSDDEKACRFVPKPGFAGSCYGNPLSKFRDEGLYPACNGQVPARVADGEGNWRQGHQWYSPDKDHRAKLNEIRRQKLLAVVEKGQRRVEALRARVDGTIRARGGSCNDLGNPVGAWVNEASLRRPDLSQFAAINNPSPKQVADALESTSLDVTTDFSFFDGMLDFVDSLLKPGAIKQMTVNYITSYSPIGLNKVFDSNFAGWGTPHPSMRNMIFGMARDMMTAGEGLGYTLLCAGKGAADAFGIELKTPLDGVNKQVCVGSWGLRYPVTGYTYSRNEPQNKALVGARGYYEAVALRGVQPDVSPHGERFNADFPQIHKNTEVSNILFPIGTAPSGKHLGSRCNTLGTADPRWYLKGESPLAVGSMVADGLEQMNPLARTDHNEGSQVHTYWKNTRCCIPWACPTNVRRDW